ncbi:MAG: agmatine deiminase family protein [Balneolaceae bacterium]|nr:agmatine deiminase family protein [Balneolaceae bacterium]MBO6546589.1 agmatine deiminase family protein [Balneolaceae bacterium]MBO6648948.1 agmatine deiminase family protein [Balneolaceae bacterium]
MNLIEAPSNWKEVQAFEGVPAKEGFHFPAEWEEHEATWLSWPHNPDTWPGKINTIYKPYCEFIKLIAEGEKVKINVRGEAMAKEAFTRIQKAGADMSRIFFYLNATNDAWCRDHGPAFLVNKDRSKKIIVDWGYNAWGGKYPPFDLDDEIPKRIAGQLRLPVTKPGIIMEGGSVDFNGKGTVLTTTSCLLNKNRNPHITKEEIEEYLKNYYGVTQILWLGDGIVGDDTDGHIDDITRFVNENTVVTVIEGNESDENYKPLMANQELLMGLTDNQSPLTVIDLPMPSPVYYQGQRLPASYANFYIANKYVIVPVFNDPNDEKALEILQDCFSDRVVIGINSLDLIWGLGSFHCLSQQEPKIR